VANQQFWATAHDCTNDEAELISADDVIIEVAQDLRSNAAGVASEVLRLFVEGYSALQVTKVITGAPHAFQLRETTRLSGKSTVTMGAVFALESAC
jgi:hypothetical protein